MYRENIAVVDISECLGVCSSSIYRHLDGMPRRIPQSKHGDKIRKHLGRLARTAKCRSSRNGDINTDYLVKLFKKQKGRCALTGIKMLPRTKSHYSISIDRISGSRGYVKGNIRLTCKFANLARHTLPDKDFHNFMKSLIKDYKQRLD